MLDRVLGTDEAEIISFRMQATVQISLDVLSIDEAVATAEMALRAGVDWLEAGTPLIIAEGMHGVRALRERFPDRRRSSPT